jgi:hypothetical protein
VVLFSTFSAKMSYTKRKISDMSKMGDDLGTYALLGWSMDVSDSENS